MATRRRKSSLEAMALEPVNLHKRRRTRVYLTLFVLLSLLGAFVGGHLFSMHRQTSSVVEQENLRASVAELQRELRMAREELALYRTGSEVAQQAQEKVRAEIKDLRGQIAELEEAVAFYKNVMSPGSGEEGLRIERLDLATTAEAGVYTYRLVLTQVGDNRRYLRGGISLILSGHRGDEAVSLNASELLAQGSETSFRFRYFQELTGRLSLPFDVVPEQVTIEATSTAGRQQTSERNFIWQLQERGSAWAG